jgi:hypothetical protein
VTDSSSSTSIPAPKKRRGRRPAPRTVKIRRMLSKGMPPREIASRLNINVQNVYNVQYQDRKKGIASLPAATSAPTAAPTTPQTLGDLIKQEQDKVGQFAPQPPAPTPEPSAPTPAVFVADTSASRYLPDLPAPAPTPSLWRRVLGWFGWR